MSIRTTGKFLEGSGLGLDRCIDNFLALPSNAKKILKIIIVIIKKLIIIYV